MRWYHVIIPTILLLQLFGVHSEDAENSSTPSVTNPTPPPTKPQPQPLPSDTTCQDLDKLESALKGLIDSEGRVDLSEATQEQIKQLENKVAENKKNAWSCNFAIKMIGNPKVKELLLPKHVIGLELSENPELTTINIPKFIKGDVLITRNNKLNGNLRQLKDILKVCKAENSNKCEIQEDNECWFESSDITKASVFDKCTKITSKVDIDRMDDEKIPNKFEKISCFSVTNSKIKNLDFLSKVPKIECDEMNQIKIENNKQLCLSYGQIKKVVAKITTKFLLRGNYDSACKELKCSFDDYKEAKTASDEKSCKIIEGEVSLDCSVDKDLISTKIDKLVGGLVLKKCNSAEVKKILNQFTEIDAGQKVAITLKETKDLSKLALGKVKLAGSKLLKVEHSKALPYFDAERLKTDTNIEDGKLDLGEVEQPPKGDGVCPLKDTVEAVNETCKVIYGDLILNHLSTSVSATVKEVQGCIQMREVTLTNYDFLKGLKVKGECMTKPGSNELIGNPCIPRDVRQSMEQEIREVLMKPENNNNAECECLYTSPVTEIPEKCKLIDGDLIVDKQARTIPNVIEEVTGCIRVSNDTTVDFSFLKGIKTFNENCEYRNDFTGIEAECIHPSIIKAMKTELRSKIPFDPPREQCGECHGALVQDLASGCKTVYGDVKVEGVKDSAEVETAMATVEEIVGRLIIQKNDAAKITFPSLKKITLIGKQGVPLDIVDNKNLVSLGLPALESITIDGSKNGTLINIDKNPKWDPSKTPLDNIVTGGCSDTKGSGCYLKQAKANEAAKTDEKKKNTEEEESKQSLYIGLGIFGAILFLIGVGGIVGVVFYIRKKKSKTNGIEGKPGKGPDPEFEKQILEDRKKERNSQKSLTKSQNSNAPTIKPSEITPAGQEATPGGTGAAPEGKGPAPGGAVAAPAAQRAPAEGQAAPPPAVPEAAPPAASAAGAPQKSGADGAASNAPEPTKIVMNKSK